MEEFFYQQVQGGNSPRQDLESFRLLSKQKSSNSDSIKTGYDITDLASKSDAIVLNVEYVFFHNGSFEPTDEATYKNLQIQGKEVYKIAVSDLSIFNPAFVTRLYSGVIFVGREFNLTDEYWKDKLRHERRHITAPDIESSPDIWMNGFLENTKIKNKNVRTGLLAEEFWATLVQTPENVSQYKDLLDLGNRSIDLLTVLDTDILIKFFKEHTNSHVDESSYITNFRFEWESSNLEKRR